MPVLDWTLSRRRKGAGGSTKFYKVDVINMTEDDSFAEMPTTRSGYGTLRKIKSLNDLLEEEADSDNESAKSDSEPRSKQQQEPDSLSGVKQEQETSSKNWTNYLTQRSKKPVERMIVSGFSTLSRRAGGGMHACDYISVLILAKQAVWLEAPINVPTTCMYTRRHTHTHARTHTTHTHWLIIRCALLVYSYIVYSYHACIYMVYMHAHAILYIATDFSHVVLFTPSLHLSGSSPSF